MTEHLELEAFFPGLRELVYSARASCPAWSRPRAPSHCGVGAAALAGLPYTQALQEPARLRVLGLSLVPCLLWHSPGGTLLPLVCHEPPCTTEDWLALLEQAQRRLALPPPKQGDELARCLKHSLAAPLHSQARLLEALREVRDPGAGFHHMLELACQGAQRLAGSVDGLVALLRLEQAELELGTLDVSSLCAQLLAELQSGSPAPLQLQVEPDMQVCADAQSLRLALRALLSNALKFGRRLARVGLLQAPGFDVLSVEDDGAGFAIARAQGLFKPFERLHLQSEYPGLGLGLATVRAVAQRHGGWAWCDVGEPGRTAFLLALPRAEHAAARPAHA